MKRHPIGKGNLAEHNVLIAYKLAMTRKEWKWLADWCKSKVPVLMSRKKFKPTFGTICVWIFAGYTDFPKRPMCTNKIQDDVNVSLGGYLDHCSNSCKTKDPNVQSKIIATVQKTCPDATWVNTPASLEKSKKTCMRKYGYDNAFKVPKFKKKIKETTAANHDGDENYRNNEKRIATNMAKWGKGSNGDKISETLQARTQEEIDLHNQHIRETKLERYGDPYYNNPEKTKETCLDKYGCEYVFQAEEIKEKSRQTLLARTGYDHNYKGPEFQAYRRKKMKELYGEEEPLRVYSIKMKFK